MDFKFGKMAVKHDPRTLKLADYVNFAKLPPPPSALDNSRFVAAWPMFGNDRLGDCTIAAFAHMTQLWMAMSGKAKMPTEKSVENLYYAIGRTENPGQSKPDNGLVMLDVMNWMSKHTIATEKVAAYVKVDLRNHDHVKQAIMLFGGVDIGFGISQPDKLFQEFGAGTPWTPESGAVTEGHSVPLVGWDTSTFNCVTWGRTQRGTGAWLDSMGDEGYAIIPQTWKAKGAIPNGLDWAALQADLAAIRGN